MTMRPPGPQDGFIPPKNPSGRNGKRNGGYIDRKGNKWIPRPGGHGGDHWDVEGPGGYTNRYPGGSERGGSGQRPNIPPPTNGDNSSEAAKNIGIAIGAGLLIWQGIKWGTAIALAPETGGGSLVAAFELP